MTSLESTARYLSLAWGVDSAVLDGAYFESDFETLLEEVIRELLGTPSPILSIFVPSNLLCC